MRPTPLLRSVLLRVIPVSVLVLVMIWWFVMGATKNSLLEEAQLRVSEAALLIAESEGEYLKGLLRTVQNIASSSLTIKVLIDQDSQDQSYIEVLLRSMRLDSIQPETVSILDYRGRLLAGLSPLPESYRAEVVNQVLAGGVDWLHVDDTADKFYFATPIFYQNHPEGVLFVEIELKDLIVAIGEHLKLGTVLYRQETYQLLFNGGGGGMRTDLPTLLPVGSDESVIEAEAALPVLSGVMLRYQEPVVKVLSQVNRLHKVLITVLLLTLFALVLGIVFAAHSIATPIRKFGDQLLAMGGQPAGHNREVEKVGTREVDQLVDIYNQLHQQGTQLSSELVKERDYLDQVMTSVGEGIWDWNIPENRVSHNQSWVDLMGLAEVFLEHPVEDFVHLIHPEDQDQVFNKVQRAVESGEMYYSEHRLRHADGHYVWVIDRGQVVEWDGDLQPIRMFGTVADITSRVEAEQRLEESKREVERVSLAKDEFLASMSHELRTPLTSIIGNSELLLDRGRESGGVAGGTSQDDQEILRSIHNAGKNQLALVNDILDMSKIESGKFTIDEVPYDLSLLLRELEQMFSVRADDAGIQFVVEQRNRESHLLIGDVQRVSQILINLIGNAIKFTTEGEVRVTTWVGAEKLIFQVKDTGIGMSREALDNLFQRFHQADGSISRSFGGSGLGLYISEGLAHLMGGEIDASSQEGSGSIFELTLPYKRSDTEIQQAGSVEQEPSVLDEQLHGSVLIAEDTPELQLLERRILESIGLIVTTANNGQEAIDQVNQHHFDLILMDMQMPMVDGIEATRILRAQGHTLPIIALTANVMQKHRDAFSEAGCDGFLGKPIDKLELRKTLKLHLLKEGEPHSLPASAEEEVDEELMAIFAESSRQRGIDLRRALAAEDWQQVREIAHAVKGSGASFGYPALSKMAEQLQHTIDQHQRGEAAAVAKELLVQLDKLLP